MKLTKKLTIYGTKKSKQNTPGRTQ
jgi:hypothetical protein